MRFFVLATFILSSLACSCFGICPSSSLPVGSVSDAPGSPASSLPVSPASSAPGAACTVGSVCSPSAALAVCGFVRTQRQAESCSNGLTPPSSAPATSSSPSGNATNGEPSPVPCPSCTGNDTIMYITDLNNPIVELQTILTVPNEPPSIGSVFVWPGLEPDPSSPTIAPIGAGVLQPVLVWGPICTPGNQPAAYSTWWISGQYVNTNNDPGYTGCLSGSIMSVKVGDSLAIDMKLNGQTWTQTITDAQTGQSVAYSISLQGQAQTVVVFEIEEYGQKPGSPVVYANSSYTSTSPQTSCNVVNSAAIRPRDILSPAVLSSNGLTCSIQSITQYGVPQ
jgi:hypothetical protein